MTTINSSTTPVPSPTATKPYRDWWTVGFIAALLVAGIVAAVAVFGRSDGSRPYILSTVSCTTGTGILGGTSFAKGEITNITSKPHVYTIAADFAYNGDAALDGQWGTTDVAVDPGQTMRWAVVHNHAGAIDSVNCGGTVDSIDGTRVSS